MKKMQRTALTLFACLAIIVVAFLLLSYGRRNEIAFILFFGRALDALVAAGLVGNLIIFLLRFTSLDPLKTALWTMLAVHGVLLIVAWLVGSRVDPSFALGSVVVAYVGSFLIWFGVHWVAAQRPTHTSLPT